jgi:hypothetical protein
MHNLSAWHLLLFQQQLYTTQLQPPVGLAVLQLFTLWTVDIHNFFELFVDHLFEMFR